jgi:hypothetical protein
MQAVDDINETNVNSTQRHMTWHLSSCRIVSFFLLLWLRGRPDGDGLDCGACVQRAMHVGIRKVGVVLINLCMYIFSTLNWSYNDD